MPFTLTSTAPAFVNEEKNWLPAKEQQSTILNYRRHNILHKKVLNFKILVGTLSVSF